MISKPKVIFENVSKRYTLHPRKIDWLLDMLTFKKSNSSFYALRDVSFTVFEGETIGIIGINGSGKSTMSNLLAEVVPPTSGQIKIEGNSSLIAISAGLNNNLTGLENITLKCMMHGIKKREIETLIPQIMDFADIGDFINQPVKNYSSGMKSRLGFAISVHTDPDVMIIDEALSVGDQTFYNKCLDKMNEFKEKGKTIFFISHSESQVRSFCDKVIWLHFGEIKEFGDSSTVLANYRKFINWFNQLKVEERKAHKQDQLAQQKRDNNKDVMSNESRTGRSKKTKKAQIGSILQFLLLLLMVIVSGLMMLFNIEASSLNIIQNDSITSTMDKEIDKSITKKEVRIDKIGYISSDNIQVFRTADLEDTMFTLNFMEAVEVMEETNGNYYIKYNGELGYVNYDNIYIPENAFVKSDINLINFLPAFPESFQNAYEYYLAFLFEGKDSIKEKIFGKTGESSDEFGNHFLNFGDVQYRINQAGISDEITVKNINLESVDSEELFEQAAYKSKNGKLISIHTSDSIFLINIEDKTFTIKKKGN